MPACAEANSPPEICSALWPLPPWLSTQFVTCVRSELALPFSEGTAAARAAMPTTSTTSRVMVTASRSPAGAPLLQNGEGPPAGGPSVSPCRRGSWAL